MYFWERQRGREEHEQKPAASQFAQTDIAGLFVRRYTRVGQGSGENLDILLQALKKE